MGASCTHQGRLDRPNGRVGVVVDDTSGQGQLRQLPN
jgi:hypothetical protein